ncbi:hypothetical protein HELRODRAFT_172475 [Helobdella robusta]|uniref:Small ribosomal subunit protein uS15m n=1 Tax=Helobdella robusta TaxID=6412 RepID=T1F5D3_HELRO|nr:hypothetical protein HELRODRAFT_172475 [Helobdella robusta]ESO04800.1 hypothetical protein HELRODRAFT_172475 [Helobdella robusta]
MWSGVLQRQYNGSMTFIAFLAFTIGRFHFKIPWLRVKVNSFEEDCRKMSFGFKLAVRFLLDSNCSIHKLSYSYLKNQIQNYEKEIEIPVVAHKRGNHTIQNGTTDIELKAVSDLSEEVVKVDLSCPRPGFDKLKQYNEADDVIKKLFSLEFSTKQVTLEKMMEEVVSMVQDHPLDVKSMEVEIAKDTVAIRNQIKHCLKFRHDKYSISVLRNRISRRNDKLGELLSADKEKFDWLTAKLQLKYTPPSKYSHLEKLSKRALRKKVARDFALQLVKEKNETLKKKLSEERIRFDKYKEEELDKIIKELKELDIDEVTSLADTLKALDREDLIPKKVEVPSRRQLLYSKKLEIYMKKKEEVDDQKLKANGFFTPREFPNIPDKLFF